LKTIVLSICLSIVGVTLVGCFRSKVNKIEDARIALAENPSDRNGLSVLKQSLEEHDPYLRAQAVIALGSLGDQHGSILGSEVVPLLVGKIKDGEGAVRRNAILALSHYKTLAHLGITNLIEVLSRFPGHDSAWFAADLLGELGTNGVTAIPSLVEALSNRDAAGKTYEGTLQTHAAEALYKLSPHAPELAGKLGPILRTLDLDAKLYELHTPTIAPVLPTNFERRASFSVANASRIEAKITYV
jgi:HEAT repeat protein